MFYLVSCVKKFSVHFERSLVFEKGNLYANLLVAGRTVSFANLIWNGADFDIFFAFIQRFSGIAWICFFTPVPKGLIEFWCRLVQPRGSFECRGGSSLGRGSHSPQGKAWEWLPHTLWLPQTCAAFFEIVCCLEFERSKTFFFYTTFSHFLNMLKPPAGGKAELC